MMMMMMIMMMMIIIIIIMSKGPPIPCFKYEPQSMLENSNYKLYYDMSIMSDQTIHNNRQDTSYTRQNQQRNTLNRCISSQ